MSTHFHYPRGACGAVLSLMLSLTCVLNATADEPSLANQAAKLLHRRCGECHGGTKQEGGLRFDRWGDELPTGDSGAAIVARMWSEGELPRRIQLPADDAERMPPAEAGEVLSPDEVDLIKRWIEAGAERPTEQVADPVTRHRMFQPIDRAAVVAGAQSIDAFIDSALTERKLVRNHLADRRTLVRRLFLDVLGLPPSPDQVAKFVASDDPQAYEKLVDAALASPRYGERWARHWLDVVRFAESNGFETNTERKNAWPYRDYVIASLNADKPYDQFVREQLAGDVLGAPVATGFLVGGSYDQVKSPDPVLTAQQRADELHDMISTTGSAFMGLTVGCARCHSHKFDPIPQTDYYALKAVLEGVQHGERPVTIEPDAQREKRRRDAINALAETTARLDRMELLADPHATTPRRSGTQPGKNVERFSPIEAKFVRFTIQSTNGSEPCLDELEVFSAEEAPRNVALATNGAAATSSSDLPGYPIHKLEHINDGRYGNDRSWISNEAGRGVMTISFRTRELIDRLVWSRDRNVPPQYTDRTATQYEIAVSLDGQEWNVVASHADRAPFGSPAPSGGDDGEAAALRNQLQSRQKELEREIAALSNSPMAYVGNFASAQPTMRLHRGDVTQPREAIAPGGLSELGNAWRLPADAAESERRQKLAEWITSPEHPLTARVIANRVWQHHFGIGLVETSSDFGRGGAVCSHPELLDWLATKLIDSGWSLKAIHREILLSQTYRQSGAARADGLAIDSGSRYLWRFPPRRVEAEVVRDAMLSTSGVLDLRMGGPGFDLFEPNGNYVKVYRSRATFGPETFRRMVYQSKPRMQLDDTFGAFDCPDAGQIAPKRHRSTTALQALNLLNSPFALEQSQLAAKRLELEAPGNVAQQVRRAFENTLQRSPDDEELSAATELVAEHGLPSLCRALFNANEFLYIE
jgi:mono/diheme cytochrome c family protein